MRILALLSVLPIALCIPNAGAHEQVQLSSPSAKENGVTQAWNALKGCLHWLDEVAFSQAKSKEVHHANRTVYETLLADKHFSKFAFLLAQDSDAVNYLSGKNETFTLFAPANVAFPDPNPHKLPEELGDVTSLVTLYHYFVKFPNDESDNERRRAIVKHILHAVLQYHILPHGAYHALSLSRNSTVATALTLPHSTFLSSPQRLHLLPSLHILPTLALNFDSLIIRPDIAAINGIVHATNKPISLPESVMDGLYRVPWLSNIGGRVPFIFSLTASALGKTGLDSALNWVPAQGGRASGLSPFEDELETSALAPGGWHWTGEPAVTFFAPENKAWEALPSELTKFLFGPFGGPVLKKLLQYHIINGSVVCADWLKATTVAGPKELDVLLSNLADNAERDVYDLDSEVDVDSPKSDLYVTLPSLLPDHPLTIHLISNNILPFPRQPTWYKVDVQGKHVEIVDWIARNGVVHVLGEVLNPLHGKKEPNGGRKNGGEWEGWEDWLVKWGPET